MITAPILGLLAIIGVLTPSISANPYRNSLKSGESLKAFEALSYKNFLLIMQPNCNLVLYHDSTAVWSTKTGGQDYGCYATLHDGGNLVVYSPKAVTLWQSDNVTERGEYVILLQKNGDAIIYGTPKWWLVPALNLVASNTTGPPLEGNEEATLLSAMSEPTNVLYTSESLKTSESFPWEHNVLYTGESLKTGESLTCETYRCTMQTDCNFACWNGTRLSWHTGTSGKGTGCFLKFQRDARIDIYDNSNALVYRFPISWPEASYILIVQKRPILGAYGPQGWSTNWDGLTRHSTVLEFMWWSLTVAGFHERDGEVVEAMEESEGEGSVAAKLEVVEEIEENAEEKTGRQSDVGGGGNRRIGSLFGPSRNGVPTWHFGVPRWVPVRSKMSIGSNLDVLSVSTWPRFGSDFEVVPSCCT